MYTAQELIAILRRAEAEGFYGHVGAEGAKDAADAIDRLTAENERLRGIIRKCMPGADAIVDLGDGETMCLYQQRTSNDAK